MDWLWLVSVGTTDVQICLHAPSQGDVRQPDVRMELGRGARSLTLRQQHEGLMALALDQALSFPQLTPQQKSPLDGDFAANGLCFERDTNGTVVSCEVEQSAPGHFRLDGDAERLSFPGGRLLVVCPKVEPLLKHLQAELDRAGLQRDQGMVVALNTCREGLKGEPVAAGPVISQFLAERLGLRWHPSPLAPADVAAGVSGWIDLLVGNETYEASKTDVVERIMTVLNSAAGGVSPPSQVFVTPSGGMPKLKPVYPVLAARRFNRERVWILEQPEREDQDGRICRPFATGMQERLQLQLEAVEQLRRGRISAAYGIACAARAGDPGSVWAGRMQALGAIINCLPAPEAPDDYWPELAPHARQALQVEAALAEGNSPAAILRIAGLIEGLVKSVAGKYLKKQHGVRARYANIFSFPTSADRDTFVRENPCLVEDTANRFQLRLTINRKSLAAWAEKIEGAPLDQAEEKETPPMNEAKAIETALLDQEEEVQLPPLTRLVEAYLTLADTRNKIAHGEAVADESFALELLNSGLCNEHVQPFGQNFLSTQPFLAVAHSWPDLFSRLKQFRDHLDRYIEDLRSSN